MAPLISRQIGLVNLSGSVGLADAKDTGVVYLQTCIPTPRFKKRKLNFLMFYYLKIILLNDKKYNINFSLITFGMKNWPGNYLINALRAFMKFSGQFFIPNVIKQNIISFISLKKIIFDKF
jgi:hypothetical protein